MCILIQYNYAIIAKNNYITMKKSSVNWKIIFPNWVIFSTQLS